MKDEMTDAEIAEAIVKFFKEFRWSTLLILFGIVNACILIYMAYDFIFFDGGFDHPSKGITMFGLAVVPLVAGAIMRDCGD